MPVVYDVALRHFLSRAAHDASTMIPPGLLEYNIIRLEKKPCILPNTSTLYVQTTSTSEKSI
ncbi:hypothetical protein BV22DRAFT_921347 [Leucogyrophana mollusca]|uniref:Uncharacterized protein n=1 Tax=Leucogyrophana mollusca TaxID=85980 RepID=A0ACB8AYB8_9AGAM|nr:hypothetical protein BV22DRAFT_921347 [Leucogyrophana mollusca]